MENSNKKMVVRFGETRLTLPDYCNGYSKIVIIGGQNTSKHWLKDVQEITGADSQSIVFESGEANKNLKTVENLLIQLKNLGCDRKSLLISLGGGVTNDIVGFVASSYMRGIDWVAIPTSLIAQADASIGGKTGVNLNSFKNMVGSFHIPKAVLVDYKYLSTLDKKYLIEGFGEIIKMGFIYNPRILDLVSQLDSENLLGEPLNQAIELSAKAKVEIVENDTYESGERKLLNFGHTVGHAIESISLNSEEPLLHGEAVAIGMLAEAKLAELESVCKLSITDEIKSYCEKFGIKTSYKANIEEILEKISSDKKNIGKQINWTLPTETGKGIFDYQASADNIQTAINSILN